MLRDYGFVIDWEIVRCVIKGLDLEGVEMWMKRWFRRRRYVVFGFNFIWYFDGYDKLKLYGFCIYGVIDGYSWCILWFEVGFMNNDLMIIV